MQISKALLKNTRASLRFHKRLIIFLVALLIVIVGLVAVGNSLSQSLTAAGDSSGTSDTGTGVGAATGGSTTGSITISSTTEPSSTSPTPTSATSSPTPTEIIPFVDTPEYGLGGGLIALFACFIAFTLFMRRAKARKEE